MNLRIQQTILLTVGATNLGIYVYAGDQYFGIVGNIWLVGSIIVGAIQQRNNNENENINL